ncbi:hypothetical protein GCM10011386_08710 [Parapedobacter defluvii]|uniref:Urease accessory protein UreH-like transmembrane domain-containing protein n=1 Tax=Parapedobacter defluvii TaxID=2045106 RepID=A0ABQ1L7H3_9SPHI|nr:sulfite exporter TauE/SafE family protein [Parapedobacter defluvii]GGC19100.1 hypothetical protein GCM10011386_08710 [Parapedobacter defluvii]
MNYLVFAFFMGLLGSLHCIAMCGPLLLAMPADRPSKWTTLGNTLIYQLGRTLMYGLLGLVVGFIGHSINVSGWQQGMSLSIGLLLIGIGVFSISGKHVHRVARMQQFLMRPVIRWIGYWFHRPGGHFIVGILNGLLPCGMVYMALVAALNTETIQGGGTFMLLFGVGTWPAMLSAAIVGNFLKRHVRINLAAWLPIICLVMGGWFMLRGAGLDIPFLSPLIHPEGAITCQ